MRLRYFVLILSIITALCLIYAWQQVKIIQLAYQGSEKNKMHKELLDINHSLRYNLCSLKSSSYLGSKLLTENSNFEIPDRAQMMVLNLPQEKGAFNTQHSLVKGRILLGVSKLKESWPLSLIKSYIDRQAQAQDLLNTK